MNDRTVIYDRDVGPFSDAAEETLAYVLSQAGGVMELPVRAITALHGKRIVISIDAADIDKLGTTAEDDMIGRIELVD